MTQPDLQALWLQAVAHFDRDELREAEALCVQLIQHAPERPLAYTMLARICHALGLTRPATFNAFQASQRCMHASVHDILIVASLLLEVGEHHLAIAVLGFIDPEQANADALLEMGRLYSVLEDQEQALRCVRLARAAGRNGAFIDHMEGIVLSFLGPIDDAVAACEASVAKNPAYGHAHWSCAQFGRKDGARERIERMRAALELPNIDNDDVTYLHYGLFKEFDTLGETDEAWVSLMAGAQARRSITEHDAAKETAAYDALIAATPVGFLDACAEVPTDAATPIFVVGMPRTGTTLLERILGNHPQIKTCGELNDFRQQMQWVNNRRLTLTLEEQIGEYIAALDSTVLGHRYLAKTAWVTQGKGLYVDKHPMNFQWCGAILKALPHAKIIHLRRHPLDSCFSNLKELFAHKYYPYSYALDELATHYRNYARLMRHWHAIAPGRILDVRYEDLASQPDIEAKRVQAYLGLQEVEGVTDILANKTITTTASTLQLRQPIHTRNVGGWRRYAAGMAPVETLLADLVRDYESQATAELPLAAAGGI
jgi:tetratricopeptide (TPR) repeat protein